MLTWVISARHVSKTSSSVWARHAGHLLGHIIRQGFDVFKPVRMFSKVGEPKALDIFQALT